MDYQSLPHHPNDFNDPSEHWDRSSDASDQLFLLALLGVVLFIPLLIVGIVVVYLGLWWIWFFVAQFIAPLLEWVG